MVSRTESMSWVRLNGVFSTFTGCTNACKSDTILSMYAICSSMIWMLSCRLVFTWSCWIDSTSFFARYSSPSTV